jgi:hypothetical protein
MLITEDGEWPEENYLQFHVEGPRLPTGRGDYYLADARLIAAAPDLLEALQKLCAMAEHNDVACWDAEWDSARAAIVKATGEQA